MKNRFKIAAATVGVAAVSALPAGDGHSRRG